MIMVRKFSQFYNRCLHSYPTTVMATTSGVTMGLGNSICQMISDKKDLKTIDYMRATKYALFGFLISGPYCKHWLYFLDLKLIPKSKSKLRPLKMMLVDQSITPIVLNVCFLIYINFFETKSLTESCKNMKNTILPILTESYKVWPIATLINFYIIPLQHRVFFGNMVALIWNIYFSYLVAK